MDRASFSLNRAAQAVTTNQSSLSFVDRICTSVGGRVNGLAIVLLLGAATVAILLHLRSKKIEVKNNQEGSNIPNPNIQTIETKYEEIKEEARLEVESALIELYGEMKEAITSPFSESVTNTLKELDPSNTRLTMETISLAKRDLESLRLLKPYFDEGLHNWQFDKEQNRIFRGEQSHDVPIDLTESVSNITTIISLIAKYGCGSQLNVLSEEHRKIVKDGLSILIQIRAGIPKVSDPKPVGAPAEGQAKEWSDLGNDLQRLIDEGKDCGLNSIPESNLKMCMSMLPTPLDDVKFESDQTPESIIQIGKDCLDRMKLLEPYYDESLIFAEYDEQHLYPEGKILASKKKLVEENLRPEVQAIIKSLKIVRGAVYCSEKDRNLVKNGLVTLQKVTNPS